MREQDSDSVFSNMIGILTELKDFDMIDSQQAETATKGEILVSVNRSGGFTRFPKYSYFIG